MCRSFCTSKKMMNDINVYYIIKTIYDYIKNEQ